MLKVGDRAKQLRLNRVFNVCHELAPQYLNQHFLRVADSHSYRTRGSLFNFVVPSIKGCDSHTFYYHAILDWNSLPDDIKSITNTSSYKIAVKRHCSQEKQVFITIFKQIFLIILTLLYYKNLSVII